MWACTRSGRGRRTPARATAATEDDGDVGHTGRVEGGAHAGRFATDDLHLVTPPRQFHGHVGDVALDSGEGIGAHELADVHGLGIQSVGLRSEGDGSLRWTLAPGGLPDPWRPQLDPGVTPGQPPSGR